MQDFEAEHKSSPARDASGRRRALITEFSSVFALAISVIALSLGAYQARLMNVQTGLMQKQARAGVWPYISIGYSLKEEGENPGYRFEVSNDGVGPARIESVTVSLDGKPVRDWDEVFRVLFAGASVPATYSKVYGKVLPANTNRETTIQAVTISDPAQARIFYAAQNRLEMSICYCSVYDECWIARRETSSTKPVERCDTAGTTQFEQQM